MASSTIVVGGGLISKISCEQTGVDPLIRDKRRIQSWYASIASPTASCGQRKHNFHMIISFAFSQI